MKDTYKTILKPSQEALFKDRNSKFYGYAFPVKTEEDVKGHIESLKKEHYQARHWCYAYVLGEEYDQYRANDDGEPSNSAGAPIYGQLQSYDVTNVLVVVVRYFGGTKLGVGGLINAYRSGAQLALENSKIITRTIDISFSIQFEYPLLNKVMRLINDFDVKVIEQEMQLNCKFDLAIRRKEASKVIRSFEEVYGIELLENN
ncbi:IMPACT family protein [Dokdonia sp. Hel_I_53]|uniref:IMPACT family protein n=1 Tax=Dokdonia sp. Hel_I_53 TaxID=1566287 RepID=UPI00119B0DCA|nr:YigZ family protein [Dokdonia sp. Hel_I_53]TVZ53446.1 putative YigZ family protein [Dokdonia sp. Hel_I_53]